MNALKMTMMVVTLLSLFACSSDLEYENSGHYAQMRAAMLLDPMAPENNAGIVNPLDGKVAKKVVDNYQKSTYVPKDGRITAEFEIGD